LPSETSTPQRNRLRQGLLQLAARGLAARAVQQSAPVRRVLLLRPDHIGDVLLTSWAVALLRASLPSARLTYLVGPWSRDAAQGGPHVDEVRTLAYPGFTRQAKANVLEPYAQLGRTAASLRQQRFDLAVVLRADHWWGALLAQAAGIPLRIGGETPESAPFLTHAYRVPQDEPWPEQAVSIARLALGAAGVAPVAPAAVEPFKVGEPARAAAGEVWRRHGLEARVVALHPAAGAPLKSWPVERWSRLAERLIDAGVQVVLVGAPSDATLLGRIREDMRYCPPILCGQALEVSAAIYARCGVVVTVDSGAGHLAAAVGARTVRLYGPAPSSVFGPWPSGGAGQRVLETRALACAPCGFLERPPCGARTTPACMLALGVDDVLNAVELELDRS
jgi:heptosyltransferase-2/heptosyltransferase-3